MTATKNGLVTVGKTEPLTPEQTAAAERVVRRHVPEEDVAGVLGLLGLT